MKTYRLNKQDLEDKNWAVIFRVFEKDTSLIKRFLKNAKTQKKLPANDLDNLIGDIGKHTRQYIQMNCSGAVDYF